VAQGDTAHALLLRFADGQLGGEFGNHLAKAIVTIHLRHAGRIADDLRFGRRDNHPFFDLTDVLNDSNEAMRIVTCQVVIGEVLRHDPAMFVWGPGSAEEMEGDLLQLFTLERRHQVSSLYDLVVLDIEIYP